LKRASITDRIDNITEIRGDYVSDAPPCPKSVKIELTGHCNFSCRYCARSKRLRLVGQMDRGFFEELLVDLLEAGVEELGLFYLGESFLVPWLPDAVRHSKDLGFPYVFLTTNGSLCTPDKVEACMDAGLDSLKFSLNYSDSEHFASVTKRPGAVYPEIVSNLKDAWRVREEGGFSCGVYASYIMFEGEQQHERMARLVEEVEPYTDEVYALPLYTQAALIDQDDGTRWRQPGQVRHDAGADPMLGPLHRGSCDLGWPAQRLLFRPRRAVRNGRPEAVDVHGCLALAGLSRAASRSSPSRGSPDGVFAMRLIRGRGWSGPGSSATIERIDPDDGPIGEPDFDEWPPGPVTWLWK
jgi:hypothetical protein